MSFRRLRKRWVSRLVEGASTAGELGLAFLMTAGVVHCGGRTQPGSREGAGDAAADHGIVVEGAQEMDGGIIVEVAPSPDAGIGFVEAAVFPDAGTDGGGSPWPEAPPPPDASVVVEAAMTPDSGLPDAGSDAHVGPWPEAPR